MTYLTSLAKLAFWALIVGMCAVGVAGCAPAMSNGTVTQPVAIAAEQQVVEQYYPAQWMRLSRTDYAGEFKTPNGTTCVLYSGYKAGGIDCEWKQP